jgi:hypothetical protein
MRVDSSDSDYAQCRSGAVTASNKVISEVLSIAKDAGLGTSDADMQRLPLFASFMIYKAAVMVLERLQARDASLLCVEALGCFKNMLSLIGQRWLAASKQELLRPWQRANQSNRALSSSS